MPHQSRRIAICFAIMLISLIAIFAHTMRAEAAAALGRVQVTHSG